MAAATSPILSTTPQPTYRDIILEMRSRYLGVGIFAEGHISRPSRSMSYNGFWGSPHAVFLSSASFMEHIPPACIAAPLVTLVAKESIKLGITSPTPADRVVIYAPEQLSISTNHLSIGNILLVVAPKFGFISCSKLTLSKRPGEEDPDYFKVVKSWVISDKTEIEIVENLPPSAPVVDTFYDADEKK